jgi:hypothetical protein
VDAARHFEVYESLRSGTVLESRLGGERRRVGRAVFHHR